MVFVDGRWLPTNLVLSASEARVLGEALVEAALAADGSSETGRGGLRTSGGS